MFSMIEITNDYIIIDNEYYDLDKLNLKYLINNYIYIVISYILNKLVNLSFLQICLRGIY